MPSDRRYKFLITVLTAILVYLLFSADEPFTSRQSLFYTRTTIALDSQMEAAEYRELKEKAEADLRPILSTLYIDAVPDSSSSTLLIAGFEPSSIPGPIPRIPPTVDEEPSDVEEIRVAGRVNVKKPKYPNPGSKEKVMAGSKVDKAEDPGFEWAKAELDAILKKSPSMLPST